MGDLKILRRPDRFERPLTVRFQPADMEFIGQVAEAQHCTSSDVVRTAIAQLRSLTEETA